MRNVDMNILGVDRLNRVTQNLYLLVEPNRVTQNFPSVSLVLDHLSHVSS